MGFHAQPQPSPSTSGGPGADFFDKLGWDAPVWLVSVVGALVVLGALAGLLKPALEALRPTGAAIARLRGRGREHGRAVRARQLFADHIESQLRRASEKEDWRDSRFAELEAYVEIEGDQRRFLWLPLPLRRSGARLVKSLSTGLRRSAERLILLQGEPGAGKSVALRHLAHTLATDAMRSRRLDSKIPIYVNLRGFQPPVRPVTHVHLKEYVLASLNRANSSDVEEFLDAEFDRGMKDGTWVFLFDSFDEIPDILSSTEAGDAVEEYADAVFDFLHTLNRSRGIVASREFKGPRGFGWPRFTVLRLSPRQKVDLIRKANLSREQERKVIGGLADAEGSLSDFAGNPMMLGLLCAYMKNRNSFPQGTHVLFDDYVNARLERDEQRVQRKFGLSPAALRVVGERVAFCMAAEPRLGLTPQRDALAAAVEATFGGHAHVDRALDALEFVKIASQPEPAQGTPQFSFAHRRFQEFFATCVVLREPRRVDARTLALDGRWRETAVTMLQTHQATAESDELLRCFDEVLSEPLPGRAGTPVGGVHPVPHYRWPPHSLHVLTLLRAGIADPAQRLPQPFRERIGALLRDAYRTGRRLDKKWAVEAASPAPPDIRDEILGDAAASSSSLLQEAAFAQAGRLKSLPDGLRRHIRRLLVGLSVSGELRRERVSYRAQLSRLSQPDEYLRRMSLLLAAPLAEGVIVFVILLAAAWSEYRMYQDPYRTAEFVRLRLIASAVLLAFISTVPLTFLLFRAMPVVAAGGRASRLIRAAGKVVPSWAEGRSKLYGFTGALLFGRFLIAALLAFLFLRGAPIYLWLYAVTWPIAAVSRAAGAGGTGYRSWLFLPVLEVARLVRNAAAALRPRFILNAILYVAGISVMGFLVGGIVSLADRVENDVLRIALNITLVVLFVGWLPVWLVVAISAPIVSGWRRRCDARYLGSLDEGQVFDRAGTERILRSIRSDSGLLAFVRKVRRGEFQVTAGSLAYLDDFAASAEPAEIRRKVRPLRGFAVRSISDGTLDEVARLVEERGGRCAARELGPI